MRISDWSSVVCFSDLAAYVHIHGAKLYVGVLHPHGVDQPLAREGAAGVFQEMAEQAKLCRPQRNRLSAPAAAVRGRIHFDIGLAQAAARQRGTPAAKHGPAPRCTQNGRASVRDRVCQYVWIPLVSVSLTKTNQTHTDRTYTSVK